MFTRVAMAISILGLLLPAAALAQGFNQGDKVLQLNASGVSQNDFDSTIFSIAFDLGYFVTPNIEGSFRQSFSFSDIQNQGSSWNASSRGALDYYIDMGRFWPFIGGNIGYVYGDNVSDTWEAAVEGGLKFFVNNTTFLAGMIEYQWLIDSDDDQGFSNGQWVYTLGIGFKW